MSPNQILKQTRREHDKTLEQMAEILGATTQRLSQMERGDNIPIERIKDWSNNPRLPDWARNMAYQMWMASIEQQQSAIGEQIHELGVLIRDC